MGNLTKRPFQGEQFKNLIESLISKHTVGYLDFGVKKGFYFLFIDNLVYLINEKLEIELKYPLSQLEFESIGRISFQLNIGNNLHFRMLPGQKEILEEYINSYSHPFETEKFIKMKQTLLSSHRWTCLDLGILKKTLSNEIFYFLFVDNKGYVFDIEMNFTSFPIYLTFWNSTEDICTFQIKIRNLNSSIQVNTEQKEKILNYKDSLLKYKPSLLEKIDHYKTILLTSDKPKTLLTNFFDQYLKTSFKDGKLFEIYEDDLLAPVFCSAKNIKLEISEDFRDNLESYYQKLLEILFNWNIIKREDIGEYGFLLINRSLKDIALVYYTKEFEDLYSGYFSSTEQMDIDAYINSYYSIDFLTHNDKDTIGFFAYYLFSKNGDFRILSNNSLFEANQILKEKVAEYEKNKELHLFEYSLMNSKKVQKINGYENVSIDEVDMMSGVEFEEFVGYLFKKMGYTVNLTPASGDQGIDLVVVKNGLRIGIQTKCYSNSVSNTAIQEVVAGVVHYKLSKAIVITNNYFTKSAIELAISNEVVLWDRSILKEKILELSSK